MDRIEETTVVQDKRAQGDDDIDLLDIALVIAERKRFILGFTAVAAVAAIAISLQMSPVFKSTARIMPPQQTQTAAGAVLGLMGGGGGVAAALGLKNPAELHLGMLNSRTIADALIQRFDLKAYYKKEYLQDTRMALAQATSFEAGKDGIISINVWDKDPKFAAELANAFIEELDRLQGRLAITEPSQRRLYYEGQLKYASDRLAQARLALKQSLDNSGIAMPDAQGVSMVETLAGLRAQISAKEIQIEAMRTFATDSNPDVKLQQSQLTSMRQQLARLESGGGKVAARDAVAGDGPQKLGSVDRMQDVKYYQVLYELVAKQYEMARIDEGRDPVVIQIIDKAVEPERKDKPKRAIIVVFTTLGAFILAVLWSLVGAGLKKAGANPERAARLATLRQLLSFRRRRA